MVAMKSMIEVEVQRHGTDGDMETIFKAFNKFWPGMETRHMEKAMRKQVFQPVKGHVNTLGERWVQMEDQWFKVTDTCYSYPFEEQLESILSNQHFYDALQKHRSWRRSQPQDDNTGETTLHILSKEGKVEIIETLLNDERMEDHMVRADK